MMCIKKHKNYIQYETSLKVRPGQGTNNKKNDTRKQTKTLRQYIQLALAPFGE